VKIERQTERDAAAILRAHLDGLKIKARAADTITAPMLWLKIRDLEHFVRMLEDGELSENS
jgi:hypothetical protein